MNALLKLGALTLVTGTLAVAASTPPPRNDKWITTKIAIALLTANDLAGARVNASTVDGRVTLRGKVDTDADRARAEGTAKRVQGVTQVYNMLQVTPDTRKMVTLEDAVVREGVEAALESSAGLRSSQIRVPSVTQGVVLLGGTASSLSSHLRAIRVASAVDGVHRVTTEVQCPDTLTDSEVEATAIGQAAGSDGITTKSP